jgi:hypothetical protein
MDLACSSILSLQKLRWICAPEVRSESNVAIQTGNAAVGLIKKYSNDLTATF